MDLRFVVVLAVLGLCVLGFVFSGWSPSPPVSSTLPMPTLPPGGGCGECPMLSSPAPGWCVNGTIIPGVVDECGCASPPRCDEGLSVVEANNRFALELYKKLGGGNVFFSPFSVSAALAMTFEGARGGTADEMMAVLHLPADDAARRESFKSLFLGINSVKSGYQLYTANALWPQKDYLFRGEYVQVVREYYGGEVSALDYVGDAEGSRKTINSWVEDKTNDKIRDLIPAGALNQMTRLVLTNAIYFKGTWLKQFNADETSVQDFTVSPGKTVKAEMMRRTGKDAVFNYAETDELQALELLYDGNETSMLILLPKGSISDMEDALTLEKIQAVRSMLHSGQVNVYIPKFRLETQYSLPQKLSALGMRSAFDPGAADFSGMDGSRNLYVSDVIHKAYVDVNEEGTEAAAATAVIVALTSVRPQTVFNADHPFVFVIQDRKSGNILFMGRLENPVQ
ncbi:MAG: serpin family protein [Candidatus Altiarchaeota archaeon]|nr:serpin family protein [Candidatus Altiarchaeota archaeon]